MKYITQTGDYLTAYQFCLSHGGQFFPSKKNDGSNTVVVGSKCYTFWDKASRMRQLVIKLCDFFGIDSEHMTGGRLVKYFINEILELPYKGTFFDKSYRRLAMSGKHWHFAKCKTYTYKDCLEIDLSSAYFSSLFSFPSLLYSHRIKYQEDNGSLSLLKEITPLLPKWFRLQFLGSICSWKHIYYVRNSNDKESKELVLKTRHHIEYGAAFNAGHRAVLRNYKIMQKISELGGDYIVRMHTDSFFIDITAPSWISEMILVYLGQKDIDYKVKGVGRCFFFDLNTGFIGNKFIGAPSEVIYLMREKGIKMKNNEYNRNCLDTFAKNHSTKSSKLVESAKQLSLFAA